MSSISLESRCKDLETALGGPRRACASPALIAVGLEFAHNARRNARADLAVRVLELLTLRAPQEASVHQQLGFVYAEEQRMPEAVDAFAQATRLDPDNPQAALAYAQSNLDAGFAAAHLFEHAHRLARGDFSVLRGWAAALADENRVDAAEALLVDVLKRHPDWLEGHKSLVTLRVTEGDTQSFAASYATACHASPSNLTLRMAWFSALVQAQHWQAALQVIEEGEALIGTCAALTVARTLVASESGDRARAEVLFAQNAFIEDDGLQIAHLRHCLRSAQLERAESLARALLKRPVAHAIWPYLSIIWRLRGDPRSEWLDGAPPRIGVFDLDYSTRDLEQLSAVLRRLHTARAPYLEQSVRGGTQTNTERQLFNRAEPEIQRLRARMCAAVRDYVATFSSPVPGHPLLGTPRERILFSGSWSVRLSGGGFHVSHTHPRGWISSALYVSLPRSDRLGAPPAGWISLGEPPPTLGVNLPAYQKVEPKPGRLVLFPSLLWHRTLPFDDGERLVVAFDVMRPRL